MRSKSLGTIYFSAIINNTVLKLKFVILNHASGFGTILNIYSFKSYRF
nr:MAG TPA: hypothetical protein [Bacteriophage sp.]